MSFKKPRAVFTQIHNESIFFPLWIKYYGQFFDPEDTYCIHLLKPKEVDFDRWLPSQTGFVRIPMSDVQTCDYQAMADRVCAVQRELLQRYEVVLFAEADEFVAHEVGLSTYINDWQGQVAVCNGHEIVHKTEDESPLDLSRPILPQRKWWYHSHLYDKPLLTRIPLSYCWGFHHCTQVPWETTDPNLLLIHLNKVDYGIGVGRRIARLANEDDSELVKNHPPGSPGWQNYISEFDMRNWWKLNVDTGEFAQWTEIPEHIRSRIPL